MTAAALALPPYMSPLPYYEISGALSSAACAPVPDRAACQALWKKYDMMEHICRHSEQVAALATALAERALALGMPVQVEAVRASALLHDLAKSYAIRHGGSHAQLGAAWVVAESGHYAIAQGVRFHVHWPWEIPRDQRVCSLPFFVLYADKRIRHDQCVSLTERYDDLLVRYGSTEQSRKGIGLSFAQGKTLERALEAQLDWEIHACTLDSGRLVQRA